MRKEQVTLAASSAYGAKYDAAIKTGLRHPKLIAPILKAVVPEYKDYSYDEVVQFIVRDSISDEPVDDVSAMANQMDSEMSSVSEKLIRYDSRFKAINPRLSNTTIDFYLHIDLEVQNDYKPQNPSYPIIKRAIYYGARELGSQLGILTNATDYSKVEKTYTIWICNENIPRDLQNTVTSYTITKKDEIGFTNEPLMDYDLMTIIIVRRGEYSSDDEIFDYLEGYFKSDLERIGKYADIRDKEVQKEVEKMSGMGESLYNKGYAQGISQGISQGIINNLISLVKKNLLGLKDAAREANMTEEEFAKLLENK